MATVGKRVAFLLRTMPHYRVRFLECLRSSLAQGGIELAVYYGGPSQRESPKRDTVELDWGTRLPTRRWRLGTREIEWPGVLRHLSGFDLVIMTQEAKLLPNYFLHTWRYLGGPRIAYWGHGRNFQPRPGAWAPEGVKRLSARLVDWWFAYTDLTARVLMDFAVPRDRITVVNNSIDTSALRSWREQVGAAEIEAFRRSLGIQSEQVAIFSGGMHADKRIDFLLDACLAIRRQIPDFEMIFVGDGPEAGLVRNAAAQHRWIHFLGPLFDADRVLPFAAAKVTLMPGLVGLVILDAFVFEAPLVTVTAPYHSPEIAYLKNEENGLMVDAGSDPDKYADAVASLMADVRRLGRLQEGCRRAALRYSVEDMGLRFAEGVVSALERYPRDMGGD